MLRDKWVLAVSGTHGKTTTTSMLAWILEYAGLNPGFLIGGVPSNFGISARLGGSKYFVVEADEYDTAFFDKRAKFVHYRPRTLIVNNIEYDHADIYQRRRRDHLAVPPVAAHGARQRAHRRERQGREHRAALERGVWTPLATFSASDPAARWFGAYDSIGAESRFSIFEQGVARGSGRWSLLGQHNLENALAAIAAAGHVGVAPETALEALARVQRRQAPARAARHVRRHQPVRGFRAPSDGDRDDAAGRAEPRAAPADRRRHGAALEHDAHGRASRHAARLVRRRPIECSCSARADLGLGSRRQRSHRSASGWSSPPTCRGCLRGCSTSSTAGDQVVLMSNGSFQGLPQLLEQALAGRTAAS